MKRQTIFSFFVIVTIAAICLMTNCSPIVDTYMLIGQDSIASVDSITK